MSILTNYRGTVYATIALVAVLAVCATVLVALGKDPTVLFSALIPCVLLLINQATTDKVKQDVKEMKQNSDNTDSEN